MRAGFLGQSICSLGFGIATLQAPRLVMDEPVRESSKPVDEPLEEQASRTGQQRAGEKDTLSTASVTNPQRLCV